MLAIHQEPVSRGKYSLCFSRKENKIYHNFICNKCIPNQPDIHSSFVLGLLDISCLLAQECLKGFNCKESGKFVI